MIKQTLIISILSIFIFSCNSEKQRGNKARIEPPMEKSYLIDTIFHGLNDSEMKAMLVLYIDSLDMRLDSLILTDCHIHDRKVPFHQIVDKKLIFEDCKNYPNSIKILDLEKRTIISELPGFIQITRTESKPKSVDVDNEIMIYFSIEINSHDTYFVNSIDLNELTTSRLDTVVTTGDPIDGYPTIDKIDSASREVIVSYVDKDYKNKSDSIYY